VLGRYGFVRPPYYCIRASITGTVEAPAASIRSSLVLARNSLGFFLDKFFSNAFCMMSARDDF
jgi:hypothetical protein